MATQGEQIENGGDPVAPDGAALGREQLAAAMAAVAAAHQQAEDAVAAAIEAMSAGSAQKAEASSD